MFERCLVNPHVLQKLADCFAHRRSQRASDELRDDERRDNGQIIGDGVIDALDLGTGEMVDPDGSINDDVGHAARPSRYRT